MIFISRSEFAFIKSQCASNAVCPARPSWKISTCGHARLLPKRIKGFWVRGAALYAAYQRSHLFSIAHFKSRVSPAGQMTARSHQATPPWLEMTTPVQPIFYCFALFSLIYAFFIQNVRPEFHHFAHVVPVHWGRASCKSSRQYGVAPVAHVYVLSQFEAS